MSTVLQRSGWQVGPDGLLERTPEARAARDRARAARPFRERRPELLSHPVMAAGLPARLRAVLLGRGRTQQRRPA